MKIDFDKYIECLRTQRDDIVREIHRDFAQIDYSQWQQPTQKTEVVNTDNSFRFVVGMGIMACVFALYNHDDDKIFYTFVVLAFLCFLFGIFRYKKDKTCNYDVNEGSGFVFQQAALSLSQSVKSAKNKASDNWDASVRGLIDKLNKEIIPSDLPFELRNQIYNGISTTIVKVPQFVENPLITFNKLVPKSDIIGFKSQVSDFEKAIVASIDECFAKQSAIWKEQKEKVEASTAIEQYKD